MSDHENNPGWIKRSQWQVKSVGKNPEVIARVLTMHRAKWRDIPVAPQEFCVPRYLVNLRTTQGEIWVLGQRPDGTWIRWAAPLATVEHLQQVFVI